MIFLKKLIEATTDGYRRKRCPEFSTPRFFSLGMSGLGCTDLERTTAHYQSILGLSETAKGHDKETYLSIGYEHHNVILKKTEQKSLLSLGYQLKPNIEIANFVKELRDLGLRPETKSDSQPGIASLIEVEAVPGHVLQFYSHIDSPAPGFKEGGVAPLRLGHVAVISPEADKLRRFYEDFLGFWYTDEFEGIATFLTCNRDHHVINLVHVPESRVHHVAFQLKDNAAHPSRLRQADAMPERRRSGGLPAIRRVTTWHPTTTIPSASWSSSTPRWTYSFPSSACARRVLGMSTFR